MDKTKFAYLAGIIDGEGCFYISKSNKKIPVYCVKLKVMMTHFPTIIKINDIFPVAVLSKRSRSKYKNCLCWLVGMKKLKILIPKIEEFLVCKKEELVIIK